MARILLSQKVWDLSEKHYVDYIDPAGDSYKIAYLRGLEAVFENILEVVTVGVGLASFIMLIIGGFKFSFISKIFLSFF